jgi:outer membrane protein TolC
VTNLVEFKRMELGRRDLKLKQALSFRQRFVPSVRVSVDMGWYRNSKTGQTGYLTREGSFDGSLNVGIGVPLFEKNASLNAWRKSSLALEKHALLLLETKESKEAELIEAVQNHDNELILLPVGERRLESSRINYERVAESYSLGVGSLLDLYQASQNYRKSKESLTELRVTLVMLRARIGYLMGDTMKYLR